MDTLLLTLNDLQLKNSTPFSKDTVKGVCVRERLRKFSFLIVIWKQVNYGALEMQKEGACSKMLPSGEWKKLDSRWWTLGIVNRPVAWIREERGEVIVRKTNEASFEEQSSGGREYMVKQLPDNRQVTASWMSGRITHQLDDLLLNRTQ